MQREGEMNAVSCWLTGVTVLVWDRNESLLNDQLQQEQTSALSGSLRSLRRGQQRPRRGGGASSEGGKLMKKKLASLEEAGAKSKTTAGGMMEKQTQKRKKTWENHENNRVFVLLSSFHIQKCPSFI